MALNTKVKWYSHAMTGIPAQSTSYRQTAGKAVELLDAILVNGFNLVTVDSIVINNNIATLTRSAGITFIVDQVIEIAGATPSALNGEWRVASVDNGTNTLTFATSGISNQTASGTITCKTPGLGWEIVFAETNKRVYRSQNVDSPRSYYRVDDTSTAFATSGGWIDPYGQMTDIDNGTENWGEFAQSGVRCYIPRNYGTEFFAVGDDRTFYLHARDYFAYSGNTYGGVSGFGDFISLRPNDSKNEFICTPGQNGGTTGGLAYLGHAISWGTFTNYGRRLRQGVNGITAARHDGVSNLGVAVSGYGGLAFPSVVDNNIVVTDMLIREEGSGGNPIRGRNRGIYWVMSNQPLAASWSPQFVTGVVGLEGRVCALVYFMAISVSNTTTPVNGGRVLFDIYGPWD